MSNTFGIHSVGLNSFNEPLEKHCAYDQKQRNILVTLLRIHNLVFNILGYIPGVSSVSGCVRMATGTMMCAVALLKNDKDSLIARRYDELLFTGLAQIARGAFEALVPYGFVANGILDVYGTIHNFYYELKARASKIEPTKGFFAEPGYPFPFGLLYLA